MISKICSELNIQTYQVENTLELLDSGATIPFIARYRKERTGQLDEVQIKSIRDLSNLYLTLQKRKQSILESLNELGVLSTELENKINQTDNLSELEDLYLPFKPKRKTRASIAIEQGLEPLAKMLMAQNSTNIEEAVTRYINASKGVNDVETALKGAMDIVAEWMNENASIRKRLRRLFEREAQITSKVIGTKKEEAQKFEMYFDWAENIKSIPSHRLLAIFRGQNEGFLRIHVQPDPERALQILDEYFIKHGSTTKEYLLKTTRDCYSRLLKPSLETELTKNAKEKADTEAIRIFSTNLKQLLMGSSMRNKRVLAIDPGFRTGCKLVCLNENGDFLHNETIYPHAPQNQSKQAINKIEQLVSMYKIDVIAIGNGTAGRETENLVRRIRFNQSVKSIMVSESGASVYSASAVAREEFPEYDVTVRGAISIGRRLIDPLSELVKIEPQAIGVGQYQHDVDQSLLSKSLDEEVVSCVNAVGVDLNTSSKQLLTYVSGVGPVLAENIMAYRREKGNFKNRKELLKVKRFGEKAFEQSAGFVRVHNGENPLDASAVHPESYSLVEKMAKDLKLPVAELIGNKEALDKLKLENYQNEQFGLATLNDIKKELLKPGLDPRSDFKIWEFDSSVNHINDLKTGMILPGIITNITAFGAFVDVGVHQDGLVHKSQMAKTYVSDPSQYAQLGQKLKVKVLSVDTERKRIQFSMLLD
ncbi:MAG: RNA-binding transcriptional accessory protein [Bacteroidales bacterium]|nr:RNA-binding transcriptional accessory protein [Bacteroidales bacterium]